MTTPTKICRSSAKQLKLDGIKKAGKTAKPWAAKARSAIERLPTGSVFTAEDLRKRVKGDPPHANAWGTVLHNASKAGLIVRQGYRQGERPESHARIMAVWCRA